VGKLRELAGASAAPAPAPAAGSADAQWLADFSAALADDLNISAAWGAVFQWVSETNKRLAGGVVTPVEAAAALANWTRMDSVLGVGAKAEAAEIPAEITALLEARQAARQARDFKRSDALRDELKAKGWVIEDTPKGPKLKQA
jgi:cysteinyl-tRNA synthetase